METLPAGLRKVLAPASAKAVWNGLTPIARRDFVSWIESAKQPETRKRRIDRVPDMLASGKRRPCCFAVVPMGIYKALDAKPKAKAVWKGLAPDERRDFTDWVEKAKDPKENADRIQKACTMLAAGKRRP